MRSPSWLRPSPFETALFSLDPARIYGFISLIFVLNRVFEVLGWSNSALRSWLDDVLVLPLALGFALWVHRRRGRSPEWTIPVFQVILAVVLYSVFFEMILPVFSTRATSDPLDLIAYGAGGVLFHFALNRPGQTLDYEETM